MTFLFRAERPRETLSRRGEGKGRSGPGSGYDTSPVRGEHQRAAEHGKVTGKRSFN